MPPRLGAFLAIVFWGLSFVATKAALRELSPITLIATRFALGLALLLVLLRARRVPLLPPRDVWRALALMGFVGVFVHQLLQSFALTMTGAINAGWLIGLTPLWSAALSAWLLRERFPPAKVAGGSGRPGSPCPPPEEIC
jgi:drug/metabolite transporter (DMT)-like permease